MYMNLNQLVISRNGYTLLDYLSDIGGMNGMLVSCATFLLAFWNYNMVYDSMITKLFKMQQPKRSTDSFQKGQETLKMTAHCFYNQL